MIKKHIFYNQVKSKDFQEFIDSYSLGAFNAKVLLFILFKVRYLMSINGARYIYAKSY